MLVEKTVKKVEDRRSPRPKVLIRCSLCGKQFLIHNYRTKISKRCFCSKKCRSIWGRNFAKEIGLGINNKGRKASRKTREKMMLRKGEKAGNWKGGRYITKEGYVVIYSLGHPHPKSENYVYEHRLVMEEHLGRFLLQSDIVHHIDGNRSNNVIANLMLFKSHRDHKLHHIKFVKEESISVRG